MPIYEFKCLNCNKRIEILFTKVDKRVEMKCNHCASRELEKIISLTKSATNRQIEDHNRSSFHIKENNCSSGSCTTYKIPGTH